MEEQIYQHFRKEERTFVDTVHSWINQVEEQFAPYLTDFLDPRQQYIVEMLVGKKGDIHFSFYGGYEQAERRRALFYPAYFEPQQDDFEITLFQINYPVKFTELSHGRILGSLTGSGLKREVFGDIISDGEQWQVFVERNIGSYIQNQVTKIGRVNVRMEEIPYTSMVLPKDGWTYVHETVSSMRLDTIISSIYNISRQRAKELITAGKVKLNWSVCEKPDFEMDISDILSIRGYGRIQVKNIEGRSKKDKLKVEFGVLFK